MEDINPMSPEVAIRALKLSDLPFVSADMIAPVLRMKPDVLRKHVRDGEYTLSEVDVCGGRIRFARKDFLQKIGELPADPPEKSFNQLLQEILEELKEHNRIQMCMLSFGQTVRYEEMYQKNAGAATPTL